MKTQFGKIKSARYGFCGYQDVMLGLKITIGGDGWAVDADKIGHWTTDIGSTTKWTEEDRIKGFGNNSAEILQLLKDAKVSFVDQLVGKPVECTFDGLSLKSWRILTEVI